MAVGAIDEHGVGEGDVEAVLDDGGGDQHVVLVVHEGEHHAFELGFAHLAVAHGDARGGHEFLDARGDFVDGFDAVVDEVDLAAALEFELDGGAHDLLVELGDHGLNGHAVFGRRLDDAHVAQADRATCAACAGWAWRDMASTSISLRSCLRRSLWRTPKRCSSSTTSRPRSWNLMSLESRRWVPMRMSTLPVSTLSTMIFLLLGGAEAGDHLDVDGELREAALEGFEVLEAEDGGGREDGDLLAVLHGFERGAHGHFGFAVAHVAAEQAVHGRGAIPCRT